MRPPGSSRKAKRDFFSGVGLSISDRWDASRPRRPRGSARLQRQARALAVPGQQSGFVLMTNGDNGGALLNEIANSIRSYYGF